MAYTQTTQEVIKYMNSSFDKENLISYQMLLVLFSKLFAKEEEFLKDPGDRMGLSHYVENFLRENNFQTIVTIKDLNMIFNNNTPYNINDKELYKVFFVLIYEELSSNDPQISFKIKEAIFTLINQLQTALEEGGIEENVESIESNTVEMNHPPLETSIKTAEAIETIPQMFNFENSVSSTNFMPSVMKNSLKEEDQFINKLPKNELNLQPNLNNNVENNTDVSFIVHNKKYLRDFIIRKNLIPCRCAVCGLSEWQNKPLYLELDSTNGIYSSKNLNNLRFLCPNCYSQIGYFD